MFFQSFFNCIFSEIFSADKIYSILFVSLLHNIFLLTVVKANPIIHFNKKKKKIAGIDKIRVIERAGKDIDEFILKIPILEIYFLEGEGGISLLQPPQ